MEAENLTEPLDNSFPICESSVLSGPFREPANSVSNIGFFIVGFCLIYVAFSKKSRHGFGLGAATVFIGLASLAAHSMSTKFFAFLDFAAIFSAFTYFALTVLNKKFNFTKNAFLSVYFILYVASCSLLYFIPALRDVFFGLVIIGLVGNEFLETRKKNQKFFTGWMQKLICVFGLSAVCVLLDMNKIFCNSENHYFQLHACWHLLNAASLFLLTKYLDENYRDW